MYFIDFRNKSGFSLLAFVTILLFAVSITFGATISSAASLHKNDDGQTILSSPSNQSEKTEIIDSPIFDRFNAWVKSYVSNGYRADDEQMIYGEELAIKREKLLERLIRLDPQAALEKAVSAEISNQLPAAIAEHSEKRVSAYGDFLVFTHCGREHSGAETEDSSIGRTVVINDSKYDAFVYGRRASMTTKMNIPLQGIVIGDAMAVDESPKRILNSAERAINDSRFSEETISAEIGGKVVNFSNQSKLDNFVDEQIAWESKIGPVRPKENSANGNLAPEETTSALTLGPKKILFIRVDFSDAVGDPIIYGASGQRLTQDLAQRLYDNQVNPFFVKNSYGNTWLQVTVTSKVVRMPHTQAYYVQAKNDRESDKAMEDDARLAAFQQTGLDSNNFDFDVVGFSFTEGFNWLGQSLIGTKGSLINGGFTLPVLAHELGHNYGLLHANLWKTTDGTAIGQGRDIDYGDDFDIMGDGYTQNANSHFNVQYKHRLEWLPDANIRSLTSIGTFSYTLYAQDFGSLTTEAHALKIRKDATKNYWIEFKPQSGGNAANGALIHWDYQSNNFSQTELLDMHPATPGILDAPLAIGESFTDEESGNDYAIKITVLGKGNTTPQSLNIKVELYKNANCTYSLSPTSAPFSAAGGTTGTINVAAGTGCSWTATTSDTSWITITRGSGIANGSVAYSVAPNSGIKRDGTITVAGQTFNVSQAPGTCTYEVSPPSFNFTASGGTASYALISPSGCGTPTPTEVTGPFWIDTNTANSITVLPYSGPARSGTVTVKVMNVNGFSESLTFTVNQTSASQTVCTYTLSPSSAPSVSAIAPPSNFNINSQSGCSWSAVSDVSWITITGGSGSGSGTIAYSVAANTVTTARSGTITVAGQTFTVTQAAAAPVRRKKTLLPPTTSNKLTIDF